MITLIDRDTDGWWWTVTCDDCGNHKLFNSSETIKEWQYIKIWSGVEKHYCPSCKTN